MQPSHCSLRTAPLTGSYSNYQIKIIWTIWSLLICLLLNCETSVALHYFCPCQDAVEWWPHWSDWSVVGLLIGSDVICYRGDVHQRHDITKFSPKRAGRLAHDTGLRMHWGTMGKIKKRLIRRLCVQLLFHWPIRGLKTHQPANKKKSSTACLSSSNQKQLAAVIQ